MATYTVGVIRDFVAQHYLVGGDWGRENQLHSHHYRLEALFEGEKLDRHGYLLDIADVKVHLDALVERYRDKTINDLPEFAQQNPGIEPFARILAERLAAALAPADRGNLTALTAKLWENQEAFAIFRLTF
jgi:6-pyruvoyltetrahydropterin/6-carboxytetrahydropterin synthase